MTGCYYSMNQCEYQISYSELLTSYRAETRCRGLVLTTATTEGTKQTCSLGCDSAGRTKGTCTPAKPDVPPPLAPKTEVVVTGCVVFCPNPPMIQRYRVAQRKRGKEQRP